MERIDSGYVNRWCEWHPGEKIFFSGGLLVLALFSGHIITCSAVCVTVILAFSMTGIPVRHILKMSIFPFIFILIAVLPLFFSLGHTDAGWSFKFLPEAKSEVLRVGLRTAAAFFAVFLMVMTTSFSDFIALLRKAHVPDAILEVLQIVYNTFHVLTGVKQQIVSAQEVRLGYSSRVNGLRSTAAAASQLLLRSLRRAARVQEGLTARGLSHAPIHFARELPPFSHKRLANMSAVLLLLTLIAMTAEIPL